MKKTLVFLCSLAFIFCSSTSSYAAEWYGSSLGSWATIRQYKSAYYEQKLATCASFLQTYIESDDPELHEKLMRIKQKNEYRYWDKMKKRAENLHECIKKRIHGVVDGEDWKRTHLPSDKVIDVASECYYFIQSYDIDPKEY